MNCFVTEGGGCCCWGGCWGGENRIFAWYLNPIYLIWTKFGMDILVYPRHNHVEDFYFPQNPRWPLSAWQMDLFNPIWTKFALKFGRQLLLNPRNKLTEEFFTYRKIQDDRRGRHYGKLRNRS